MKKYEKILFSYKMVFIILSFLSIYGYWIWRLIDKADLNNKYHGSIELLTIEHFTTFTLLSNVFCQVWFIIAAIQYKREGLTKATSYTTASTLLTCITVTMLVYNAVLIPISGFPTGVIPQLSNIYNHVFMPIGFIVYVLFLMPRKKEVELNQFFLKKFYIQFLIIFIYCIFALIRGELRYQSENNGIYKYYEMVNGELKEKNFFYPYFFLNVHDKKGVGGIPGIAIFFMTFVGILGLMIGLSYLYNFSSNLIIQKNYYKNLNR
ncbi:hypothetical protein SGLAD_v1c05650 [Spiroplasma gladiatoris]|uniref:Uncharacterized protein n=1 Tax=Spiroplasma gladiatoris TaxID=2143 RepID=A0A4P7AH49_9MOLU|nr:hypothetical protein [Spiroplasma gladiatoris]QBQ07764.1 hypothetical protein SGLAD_v1c05650 [Spiroplasma gladiatoris]